MNQPINILEPFIAVGNSGFIVLILPIVFITLLSDFPKTDGNSMMVLIRTGRINWFIGQLVFALMSIITFMLLLLVSTMISVSSHAFFANGWSLVATDYDYYFPEEAGTVASSLLPANLYNQMSPYQAACGTALFLMLYFMLLASILLCFRVYKHKRLGFFTNGILIAVGAALCSLKTPFMWALPMAHSIIWLHFDERFRQRTVSETVSVAYYVVLCIVIIVLTARQMKRYDLDNYEEVD
jgi:hypothetical protein